MKKNALITGGTKGIGKSVAFSLAQKGYDLVLTYSSDKNAAESLALFIRESFHVDVHLLQADATHLESILLIDEYLKVKELNLDALILNAGITCRDSFEDISLADWERVFFANVHFPVFLLQKIIGKIKKGGSVTFTGSLMGIEPHSVSLVYGVSKSAVHSLVKNLVKFLARYGVRVNAVAPGFVDTDWQKTKPAEIRKNIESKIAVGRFGAPEEIAEVFLMLIENTYFNGEIVVVDGGYLYK
ncbi:MAG: SDR family NAD(P)-dependent oxidoreductase [Massilibacteroides sp.]|nr:SDR family NAD(P)-dependent oxidoreductase [Massilibacteroides sp.]MDD3063321.1 SDR family NAD(P)-dependent oxidoreductase [Massilibacteroides sp.]MDD4115959.1 SDR family NAD(P)-dependent oxidoreductase [Massilibacteroides sp.]MDD4660637.1 SDR family NAD(P)-dependent oxidoreductase [Massilibacteroides sp.]